MCTFALGQDEGESKRREPPKLLRGGIVQQLRALSEEAVESLKPQSMKGQTNKNQTPPSITRTRPTADRNRGYRSAASRYNKPPESGQQPVPQRQPIGNGSIQQPVPMGTTASGKISEDFISSERTSTGDDELPEIVTPEEAIARLGGGSSNAKTRPAAGVRSSRSLAPVVSSDSLNGGSSDTVHVSPKLPAAVRDSLRSSGYGAKSRYSTRSSEADQEDNTETESTRLFPSSTASKPKPNAPPKVSRVPLPGAASSKVASRNAPSQRQLPKSVSTQVKSSATPTSNPSTQLRAPQVARTKPSRPNAGSGQQRSETSSSSSNAKVASRPSSVNQNPDSGRNPSWPALPQSAPSSVQVPTKLVGTPKSEQVNRYSSGGPKAPPIPGNTYSLSSQTKTTSNKSATQGLRVPQLPAKTTTASPQVGSSPPLRRIAPSSQSAAAGMRTTNQPVPSIMRSANQRLKMETPHIVVVMNGPADLPVGSQQEYQVVVHNFDNIPLRGLILQMDVPAGVDTSAMKPSRGGIDVEKAANGATLLTWTFQELSAGELAMVPLQLTAMQSQNFAITMEWTLVPVDGSMTVQVRSAQLEMALEGPAEVKFGEANTYRLRIRNPGDAAAADVAVQLSAGPYGSSASEVGTIAAGSEEAIDVELTFNQRGVIGISAEAKAAGGLSASTEIDVLVKQANLVASVVSPQLIYHGNSVPVEVGLRNDGDAATGAVQASVQLPDGAKLVSAPPGAALQGQRLSWPVTSLAVGESRNYDIQVQLLTEGQNSFDLNCKGSNGLAVTAKSQTTVQAIADLKLTVNDPIAPAPVGSEVPYELTLTNRGSKAAHNVTVIAQFSDGIEPKRCEGGQARIVPGQAIFEPIPAIQAGETVKLRVLAVAEQNGMHRFRAEVRNAESEVRLVQEESTQYLDSVTKPITRTATIPDTGSLR